MVKKFGFYRDNLMEGKDNLFLPATSRYRDMFQVKYESFNTFSGCSQTTET